MVIIDTNILIDHLRQKKGSSFFLQLRQKLSEDIGISLLTVQELYTGNSTRNPDREEELLAVLSGLHIFPYTYEIAKKAGEIARDSKNSLTAVDSAIAATAILQKTALYTLNRKDFVEIPELEILSLE